MAPTKTVRELVAELILLDQDAVVIASTHYDYGVGFAGDVDVYESHAVPRGERAYWRQIELSDYDEDEVPPGTVPVVVVSAG